MPSGLLLGAEFWHWYEFFRESEQWSVEQIREYQLDCIKKLLNLAVTHSNYYKKSLSGIDIDALSSLKEYVQTVPAITRRQFRDNYNDIYTGIYNKRSLTRGRTSGTTGNAIQFYYSRSDIQREWAAICYQWRRVGFDPVHSKRAEFRGLISSGNLIKVYPERNMIQCNILHLKPEPLRKYADAIRKYRIDFYHGYPSALALIASNIIDRGIKFPQPKGILLASEQVHPWQLERLKNAFPAAKLYAHYGCTERTVLAGWCEYSEMYHVLPQYAFINIDEDSNEIIGTNLYNRINPFIKYRMTDTVMEVFKSVCPHCGRPYELRFRQIGGRIGDYLYSPEKGWIAPAIVTFPLNRLRQVREVQFIQRDKRKLIIKYSTDARGADDSLQKELNEILSGIHFIMGKTMNIKFERVDDFPRGKTGKFKWIINELDEARLIKKP